jgi:hypothetical protein
MQYCFKWELISLGWDSKINWGNAIFLMTRMLVVIMLVWSTKMEQLLVCQISMELDVLMVAGDRLIPTIIIKILKHLFAQAA